MSEPTSEVLAVSRRSVREADLVLRRCAELATHTSLPGGIERLHLSPQHAAANALTEAWMREAGLRTWVDAAGNLCGRLEGATAGAPALVLASHLDSVTDAGAYDGVLGVLAAVAVAGRIARSGTRLPFALEVVAFSDEEGTRFGTALAGSRAFAGAWDHRWWQRTDADGVSLYEATRAFGLDPDRIGEAARRPEDVVGYLELHIEQGPVLDDADRPLGVVTSIASARRFSVTVTGQAGHAGGTPYERRRDALVAASELVVAIERIGRASGTIATVGRLQAYPGGVNVIPGKVEMSLDLRAEHDTARDAALAEVWAAGREVGERRGVRVETTETYRADAVSFDPGLRAAVEAGIRATGDPAPLPVWSRAGHDAMAVADVTGVAMLFVRCAGGVSHHPDESVRRDDVAVALDALEAAVLAHAAAYREPAQTAIGPGTSRSELREALSACLDVPRWLDEVSAAGPFARLEQLRQVALRAADPLTPDEIAGALAHHPRIGEAPRGSDRGAGFSRREQASADAEDPQLAAAIAEGNRAYEERFGRVFLIRAAGRSRAEILGELRRRLPLDPAEELAVVGQQLREIALLRIEQLWGTR